MIFFFFNDILNKNCFHMIKIQENNNLRQCILQTNIRSKNSLFFSLRKKYQGNLTKFLFSKEQISNRFDIQPNFLVISYMTKENTERYRRDFLEKLFLSIKKTKYLKIKKKKKYR